MYGTEHEIHIKLHHPEKTAVLRLPTNADLNAFYDAAAKIKDTDSKEAEKKFFDAIRTDDGEPFDEYEAAYIIQDITTVDVRSSEKEGTDHTITLKTAFGDTVHHMHPLTIKQFTQFQSVLSRGLRNKASRDKQESLYSELMVSTEGYAEGIEIPNYHKHFVMMELYKIVYLFDPKEKNG